MARFRAKLRNPDGRQVVEVIDAITRDDAIARVRASGRTLLELKSEHDAVEIEVGSSRVDLQACKLEYSIVSPK